MGVTRGTANDRRRSSVEPDIEGRVNVAVAVGAERDMCLCGLHARDLGDPVSDDLGHLFVAAHLNDGDKVDSARHRVHGLNALEVADGSSSLVDLVDINREEANSGDHASEATRRLGARPSWSR